MRTKSLTSVHGAQKYNAAYNIMEDSMANFTLNFNKQANTGRLSLVNNNNSLQQAIKRLSTGKKFNAPSDGPASFSLLSNLSTQLQVGEQGVTNAKNGTSLLDTADAALANMEKIFTQISVLAEDAANGVWSDEQRTVFENQAKDLATVAQDITKSTEFNGTKIFDSVLTKGGLTLQIGSSDESYDQINIKLTNPVKDLDVKTVVLSKGKALTTLENVNLSLQNIRAQREIIGAKQQAIEYNINNRESMNQERKNTISNIGDADVSVEMENYTNYMAKVQASQYMYLVAMQNPSKISQMIQSI